ncbi:NTP transferase domain-containing protein [Nereida sp. MMG025]|uniref:nucleotidyltransferase family protein n=1 Tax=Nereida sp. MMG025 TaxID=2909981 RepID=UPI001F26C59B|nr:nucleotidyltransferase family protein [Nereida sp. MMG025]MCF6443334.1 nucleotidyltransferase family protein [Nereida sp. MMG025]
MKVAILVLASGASTRMRGADKLLEDVDGRPCLAHVVRRAAQACPTVYVTVPSLDHPRAQAIGDIDVNVTQVPDASEGMAASIRTGVAALPVAIDAVMIVPADMPDITGEDMAQMIAIFGVAKAKVLQATSAKMQPGHPVIFARSLFDALRSLEGDNGAKRVIEQAGKDMARIPLDGDRAILDLDTPEDWARWRTRRS